MALASRIAAGCILLALTGCAASEPKTLPSGPIAISPQTEGALSAYLRKVKVTRPGAFAVSADGRNSFYTWCNDIACATLNYVSPALWGCRSLTDTDCFILYVRHEQRLVFTLTENAGPGGQHGSWEAAPRIEWDDWHFHH